MLFNHVTLILARRLWEDAQLRVAGGFIQGVSSAGRRLKPLPGEAVVDGNGAYLAPGFIDLHVHGAMRRDTMEATAEAFDAIRAFHASGGTTALALTTVAAAPEEIERVLRFAGQYGGGPGPRFLGVHLEGPCFASSKAGAHRAEWIRLPDPRETERWLRHAEIMTQVTLAPELDGALELIKELRSHHIIVSGGHSEAWDDEASLAFAAGMSQVSHLYNAMSGARRRGLCRVAGLLEFALAEPGMRGELIADGRHVSPTLMRLACRAKGVEGITLVTDATAGAGLPEGSEYQLGDLRCVVRDGAGLTADGSALAGSVIRMIDGVRRLVRDVGVPLPEAVQMATWNPARALAFDRRRGWHPLWGSLSAGAPADLVLLSEALEVQATYVGGTLVYPGAGLTRQPDARWS